MINLVKIWLIFLRSFKSQWVRPRSCQTIFWYGSYTCEYFKISQLVFGVVAEDACYRDLIWNWIDNSTTAWSIENYDFRISKSEIRSSLVYLFGVSFLTTLDIYKDYFKGHHTRIQRPRDLFSLCEATAFVRPRIL